MADNPICNPAEFRQWADSPVTAAYLQFLKDRTSALAMQWAQRRSPSDSPEMVAAQCQAETLGDLAALQCNDVRAFYGLDEVSDNAE